MRLLPLSFRLRKNSTGIEFCVSSVTEILPDYLSFSHELVL